ncbi:uncharacterized protein [Periplaneta americana]|uniref:uncharacterized protein n=1 Tax=Periplaneta americana TaxID=6978 RepID=UPI0037E84990
MSPLLYGLILICSTTFGCTACKSSSDQSEPIRSKERRIQVSHHDIKTLLWEMTEAKKIDNDHQNYFSVKHARQVEENIVNLSGGITKREVRVRQVPVTDSKIYLKNERNTSEEQYFDNMLCNEDEMENIKWKSSLIQVWCHVGCRNNLIDSCEPESNTTEKQRFNLRCVYDGVRNYFEYSPQATCYVNMTYTNISESEKNQKCTLDCMYDISKSYTQKFIEGGDLETGQLALNLTEEYVNGTRIWMRNFKFLKPESLVYCSSCVLLNDDDNDMIALERTQNLSYGLRAIYNLLDEKTNLVKETEEIFSLAHTHNYELDRLNSIGDKKQRLSEEERSNVITRVKTIFKKYNITSVFVETTWGHKLLSLSQWKIDENLLHETYTQTEKTLSQIKTYVIFQRYVEPVVFSMIFTIGLIGNSTLLLLFVFHPEIRTTPNAIVMNIVVCDILCYVVNIPVRYVILYKPNIIQLANTPCTIYIASCLLLFHVSVLSVLGFSVQGYYATMKNVRASETITFRFLIICVILVWIISIVLSTQLAYDVEIRVTFCNKHDISGVVRALGKYFFMGGMVLLVLVLIFNYLTARQVKSSIKNMPGEMDNLDLAESRRRTYRTLNALALVFFLSYGPKILFTLALYWTNIDVMEPVYQCVDRITFYLVFAYSCFNPIALYIASSIFRKLINIHLFRLKENCEKNVG